jgi:hypothetical protein
MMLSDGFDLRELVHSNIYNHPAIGDRAADFIHPGLIITLESMRKNFSDVITVNNWHIGGNFKDSGLRDFHDANPKSASYSAHYFGTAADCKFRLHKASEVYYVILNNQGAYPYITRMENVEQTINWLHIEVGTRYGDIKIFNP